MYISTLLIDSLELEHVHHINDLGIIFKVKLNFTLHINSKVIRLTLYLVLLKETLDIYLKNLLLCYIKHYSSFTFRICCCRLVS